MQDKEETARKYIQKVIEGDMRSFNYLIDEYKDMSFSIAMSIVKDETLAGEVVQDAFVKVFRKLKTFKGKAKFSTWLYRIVVNTALSNRRKAAREIIEYVEDYSEDSISSTTNVLQDMNEEEQQKYINRTLERMNPKESLIMRLYYLNDNNHKEISEITSLSISNIKVILHRARSNFYGILHSQLKTEIRSLL